MISEPSVRPKLVQVTAIIFANAHFRELVAFADNLKAQQRQFFEVSGKTDDEPKIIGNKSRQSLAWHERCSGSAYFEE